MKLHKPKSRHNRPYKPELKPRRANAIIHSALTAALGASSIGIIASQPNTAPTYPSGGVMFGIGQLSKEQYIANRDAEIAQRIINAAEAINKQMKRLKMPKKYRAAH